jgi:hypothetical protein
MTGLLALAFNFEHTRTTPLAVATGNVTGTVTSSSAADLSRIGVRVGSGVPALGVAPGSVVSIELDRALTQPIAEGSVIALDVDRTSSGALVATDPASIASTPAAASSDDNGVAAASGNGQGPIQPDDRGPKNPDCGRPVGPGGPRPVGPPPKPCGPPPGRPASGA